MRRMSGMSVRMRGRQAAPALPHLFAARRHAGRCRRSGGNVIVEGLR